MPEISRLRATTRGAPVITRQLLLMIPITAAAGILAGPVAATPTDGQIERTDLASGSTDAPVWIVTHGEPTTFAVQTIRLMPAASSGWHSHPGPEFTAVTTGTVHVQTAAECLPAAFSGGQAVFIPGGVAHRVFNQGAVEASAVVTYTLPAGLAARLDTPDACA